MPSFSNRARSRSTQFLRSQAKLSKPFPLFLVRRDRVFFLGGCFFIALPFPRLYLNSTANSSYWKGRFAPAAAQSISTRYFPPLTLRGDSRKLPQGKRKNHFFASPLLTHTSPPCQLYIHSHVFAHCHLVTSNSIVVPLTLAVKCKMKLQTKVLDYK